VRGRTALLVLGVSLPSGETAAQTLASEGFAGVEARVLSFTRLANVRRLRQVEVPVGFIFSRGRLRIDLGSAFVSTQLLRVDSSEQRVDHVIDTQLRGAYVFGRDAVVATLALNLPTGPRHASPRDYAVLGTVSPSFLGFPVAAYANGFSATGGVAAAIPAGDWSFGFAGSLRVSSRFTPYEDGNGPVTYKPGVEGKLRAGADGLVGASRLSAGFTYSTFGDDQFGAGGTLRGAYHPGPRWLAEVALVAPLSGSTLNASLWNFRRSAGDTTGASARNKENLAGAELSLAIPISAALILEPGLSGRVSKPQSGRARMVGVGGGLQMRLTERLTLTPTARYDSGWLEDPLGARAPFHGGYGSAFLRMSF
jgi:hypothetical protein